MITSIIEQVVSFLQLGGPVVACIAGLSVVALALVLLKTTEFLVCGVGAQKRASMATRYWQQGRFGDAKDALANPKSAAEKAVETTFRLLESRAPKQTIEERVSVEASANIYQFSKGVRALEAIAQVAPLIGLFGTVLGMIEAFQALQSAGSNVDPSALAGGIWVALMTTAAGLGVAMPVSLVVTWLESRLESERVAIETLTSSLLLQLKPQVDEREQPMTEPQFSYGT